MFDAAEPKQEPEYEGLDHDRYKEMWRESVDDGSESRQQMVRDEQYYDGDVKGTGWGHWTDTELAKLGTRKQPPSVFNVIMRKINAIAGVEQRSRSEARALPRTPKDQKSAEIATDVLRYIKEQTRWEYTKADCFLEALKVGVAGCIIDGDKDTVTGEKFDWREFFWDPRSRKYDFSDARYLGFAKWMDKDVAFATYVPPELPPYQPQPAPQIPPQPLDPAYAQIWAQQAQIIIQQYQAVEQQQRAAYEAAVKRREQIITVIENTVESSTLGAANETDYEDRPRDVFNDRKRQRIFIVDMWHKDPKAGWMRCVFTGAGKLFTAKAKYKEKDQWGREVLVHPIQAFSLHVSSELWRFGEVRNMRSPQDEVNKRRSKALHLLTMNRVKTTAAAMEQAGGKETLRTEATRPDGVIVVQNLNEIEIDTNIDLAVGQQQLGEQAVQFLEQSGPNPQLQGEQGRATSGRAVLALQQAGLGALGPVFDRFHEWDLRCERSKWYRAQQYWTGPMYVRVTDDKNAARFAAVNGAPVVQADNGNTPEAGAMGAMPPQMPRGGPMQGGAMVDPRMAMGGNGGPPLTPEDMGETGPMLAELDMDIIIDRAPEAATLQAEQFESMAQLAQSGVLPPGPETARIIITSSSLPNKSEILDMLDKAAQQPKGPDPAMKAELEKMAATIEKLLADKDKAVAETEQTRVETQKLRAELPGVMADSAAKGAQARTANVDATMGEFEAEGMFNLSGLGSPQDQMGSPQGMPSDPFAAGALSGDIGLPPQQANGPPPY